MNGNVFISYVKINKLWTNQKDMKKILIALCMIISTFTVAQIPKSGTYVYKLQFAESSYSYLTDAKCKVIIDGEKIKVIFSGGGGAHSGLKNGDVIDEGIIIKHKSGSWIIGRKKSDVELDEVGGCTNGSREIDFKNKVFWTC